MLCIKEKHSYIGIQLKGNLKLKLNQLSCILFTFHVGWMILSSLTVNKFYANDLKYLYEYIFFHYLAEASLNDLISEYQQIGNYDTSEQIGESSSKEQLKLQ